MTKTDELTTYMGLMGMRLPELGNRRITDVSRLEIIAALEANLIRHQGNAIHLSKRKVKTIDECLNTAYLQMDGMLDDVPLRFACAPTSIKSVEPDMFASFLCDQPLLGIASWGKSLDESLVHRFLCDWTLLDWWELIIGYGTGILLIPHGGNDGYTRHYFELPAWVAPIEQAIRCSECPLTVLELSDLVCKL